MPPITLKQADKISSDIKKLIKKVTNIQEDDQNFAICQKFILSNFLYHRYLDVIAPDVWKKADNLHSKLVIQAQSTHARVFSDLVKKFKNLIGSTTGSSEDELCAVLFLLMKISRGTSNLCLYQKPLEYKEGITVKSILKNEEFQLIDSPDPVLVYDVSSSVEDVDELIEIQNPPVELYVGTPSSDSGFEQTPDVEIRPLLSSPSPTITLSVLNLNLNSRKWLRDNILNNAESEIVREEVIVTEILWMLRAVKKLSVFDYQFDKFSLKESVRLCSLNNEALRNFIKPFCFYANCVVNMKYFINSIVQNKFKVYHFQSEVYEAFASSLFRILQELLLPLQQLEKEVFMNMECWTLIKLQIELHKFFSNMNLVYSVFEDGVTNVEETMTKRLRVAHLLTVIGRKLEEVRLLGTNQYHLNILLTMLFESCKPYFNFIHQLINGKLVDTYEEFAIERNRSAKAEDESFWDKILILHLVENKYFVFSEILPYILLAGKSVEVLAKLGFKNSFESKNEECLYNLFLSKVLNNLGINLIEKCGDTNIGWTNEFNNYNSWMNKITSRNSLLDKNFQQFILKDKPEKKANRKTNERLEILDAEFECRKPFPLLLRNSLIPLIIEKCHISNQKAIDVLTIDHNLLRHLDLIRAFYLLEAGASMLYFCSNVFDKMLRGRNWANVFRLNTYLNEVAEATGFAKFSSNISVVINEDLVISKSPLEELLMLLLVYKVPWPINIILDNESMRVYQNIFSFLMQIKCAKYALDQLRFSTENSQTKKHSHIQYLLKMKFLCTINSIHNYFMIGILHTVHLELKDEIEKAKNVKDLVDAHKIYLKKIQTKCFLVPNLHYLKDGVFKILNLAINFAHQWNSEVDDDHYQLELSLIEEEYTRCLNFFSAMIKIAQKRGDYSSLAAFHLNSNKTDINLLFQELYL